MTHLIGLCGDIGAGKDTVGAHLVDAHGFMRVGLADKLKEVARDVFGLEERHVWGTQEEKALPLPWVTDAAGEPRSGRTILEMLGTEGFRDVDPNVWVKYAMRKVEAIHAEHGCPVVIPDVRLSNEFQAIRAQGGWVWEVVKVGGPDHGRTGHRSDQEWRSIPKDNRVVARYGDIKGLEDAVDIALHEGSLLG